MSSSGRNGSRARQALLVAAVLVFLTAAPASIAQSGCRSDAIPSPQALDAAAHEQKQQMALLGEQMDELACGGSIVVIGSTAVARCNEFDNLMARMRDNLAAIEEQLADRGARAGRQALPCPAMAGPIPGVSQFLNPNRSAVEDLSPQRSAPFRPAVPDDAGSITRIELPPATENQPSYAGSDAAPSIEVQIEPPAVARPMTRREHNARKVGPRFLPDPSQSLDLEPKAGAR